MTKYRVVKHKYTSALNCGNKARDYIERGVHCSLTKNQGKWAVCFGSFNDITKAKELRQELLQKGIKTTVTEKE